MPTPTRPFRQPRAAWLGAALAAVGAALLLAWAFMAVWIRGGPQPLRPIVIAVPAPPESATARHRA